MPLVSAQKVQLLEGASSVDTFEVPVFCLSSVPRNGGLFDHRGSPRLSREVDELKSA